MRTQISFVLVALALLSLVACQRGVDEEAREPDAAVTPAHWATLRTEWREIRDLAKAGDAAAVARRVERFVPTPAELAKLLGPEVGGRVWAGYRDEIRPALIKEAGAVLVERVKAGQVEVQVYRVGPMNAAQTTVGDRAMLDAMKVPVKMYTVRLRRADEKLGFRLNGFIYIDGHWRMLAKSYPYLAPPPKPDAGPDASASDVAAPPDAGP